MQIQRILVLLLLFSTLTFSKELELPTHVIIFEGQTHFDAAEIAEGIGVDHKSIFEFWKDDTMRIKDKLLPTLHSSLNSFYDSEGFYDAEFEIKENNTSIVVKVKENTPVLVNDVNVSSDFNISELVSFQKGEIFRAAQFIEVKGKIIQVLLKDGYCSYELDSKAYVDLEKHLVDLRYDLKKGGVCTFGKMTVRGLKTIDEDIIQSRVRAKEGDRFNMELIQDTSQSINALHAFDSVLIGVDRKFYNVVPVDIRVEEIQKPYHLEVGAGYDTYVGARVHGEVTKYNFLGNAQELSLQAAWSQREQLAILSFFKPVLFDIEDFAIDLGAKGGYSNLEFEGFKEKKFFFDTFLEHQSDQLQMKLGMALEAIEISTLDDGIELPQIEYNTFLLAYPYVNIVWDARDSKLDPKYGYYLSAYTEYGIPTDEQSSLYLKTILEARAIYTVSHLTLAMVAKIGGIKVEDDSYAGIPESKKFLVGGVNYNRAYGIREMGVITSDTVTTVYGAMSMANLSFEADYPVWGDLGAAVFVDNTMLNRDSYDYSGPIITSAGLGVRYATPIGPFKLDVGMNVNDPSQYGVQFQIGQSF